MSEPAMVAERRTDNPAIDAKVRYILDQLEALASGSSVALGLRS